jgi:anthranilate phosphoribosyltransferase
MKKILQYLFEYKTLSRERAKEILVNMSRGQYNHYRIPHAQHYHRRTAGVQ